VNTVVLSLSILLLFLTLPARAALDFEDHAFPQFVTSARALAMGNAYICKVDDAWASFYNPAGLGTVRRPQLHLANMHLEASSGLTKVLGPGPAYQIPGNYMDSFDPNEMRSMLANNKGVLAHSRFNFFPNFTVRGLTLGYMFSQRNRATINDVDPDPNDADNTFEFAERRDHGPVMSLSGSLFGGVLKLGASAVYLIRRDLYKSFAPTVETEINDDDYKSGKSLQITAGSRLTFPVALLPTFALVLRNATSNDWDGVSNNGGPDKIKQTMDVGFSITPQVGKTSRLHMEANLIDLNNAYDTDIKRRIAVGTELDFNRRLFVRLGYGDGWGSGGLGVRTRTFILDMSTYAVDRSKDDFREEEDRRWVLSISSGF
jgi:hypothetical protein